MEREEQELEKFFDSALELYEFLKSSKVKMDLTELVECADGSMDQKRFKMHVAPNRAKTGMRYARLLRGLFKEQRLEVNPFLDRDEPFEKLNCLGYMELLVQKEVGRRTPQAFLYGVDFFAKAFGFSMGGSHIDRAKRLALRYAQLHTIDRKGAPMFNRAFMHTLERMVLDPLLNTPQRIVAGKLRICIQASIRHDDLTSTPLAACEWVRRRGEVGIVGLRARAWKGKTHARAWVCSCLGVDKEHDDWLKVLMPLLVEAHGPQWRVHDHFGKMPSTRSAEDFLSKPPTIENDVITIKTALSRELNKGAEVGITSQEVETIRWHGAKATMTTLMQHLGLSPKAVRLSGGWADKNETMADVYLREAQLLTLKSQERCLLFRAIHQNQKPQQLTNKTGTICQVQPTRNGLTKL